MDAHRVLSYRLVGHARCPPCTGVLTGRARKMGRHVGGGPQESTCSCPLSCCYPYFLVTHMLNYKHKTAPGVPTCWTSSLQVGKVGVGDREEDLPRPQGEMGLELESLPIEFENKRLSLAPSLPEPPCLPESRSLSGDAAAVVLEQTLCCAC